MNATAAAVLALAAAAWADPPAKDLEPPVLTVRGEAELHRAADRLNARIGVITQGEDATAALEENNRRLQAVVAALTKIGLTGEDYETGRFAIQPRYASRPHPTPPQWEPRITGYEVTNTLSVRTRKLKLAARLLQSATEAGANTISDLHFDLADPRAHRADAITAAAGHARADADVLARAAGVRLLRALSVTLDDAAREPVRFRPQAEAMVAARSSEPPVEPGEVTVRAAVTIVYEIAPRESR